MTFMYKIGIVGGRDSVMGFTALGVVVRYAETAGEAEAALSEMEDFAVIYITETLLAGLPEARARYRDRLTPALIPIPDNRGSLGIGMENVKHNIERAVGADIIGEV